MQSGKMGLDIIAGDLNPKGHRGRPAVPGRLREQARKDHVPHNRSVVGSFVIIVIVGGDLVHATEVVIRRDAGEPALEFVEFLEIVVQIRDHMYRVDEKNQIYPVPIGQLPDVPEIAQGLFHPVSSIGRRSLENRIRGCL